MLMLKICLTPIRRKAVGKMRGIFRQVQKAGEYLGGVRWFLRVWVEVIHCPIPSLSYELDTLSKNSRKGEAMLAQIT